MRTDRTASFAASTARQQLLGLAKATHPFPLIAVVTLTGLIGVTTSEQETEIEKLILVILAMFLSQLTIGWSNDYLDRDTDAVYQPSKPLASGLVEAKWLPRLAFLACVGSLAVGTQLGAVPLLLLVIGTASGLAYNVGIKNTDVSWLPYVVAFAVLPPFVWSALDTFRTEFIWLYVVATPLTVAVHLANSLPDAATDEASGRAGIATSLSRTGSFILLATTLLAPPILLGLSALFVSFVHLWPALSGLFLYIVLTAAAAVCYLRRRPYLAFKLISIAGVIFTIGFLTSV
jgi:4-hydroxybenzoate polyprenyltransferase